MVESRGSTLSCVKSKLTSGLMQKNPANHYVHPKIEPKIGGASNV